MPKSSIELQMLLNFYHGDTSKLPKSTTSKLIFPYDYNTGKYDTGFYIPALTQERLSKQDIESFMNEIQALPLGTMGKLDKCLTWVFYLLLFIVIISTWTRFMITPNFLDMNFQYCAIALFLVARFYFFKAYKSFNRKAILDSVNIIVARHNAGINQHGWKWHFPEDFTSIELCNSYKDSESSVENELTIDFKLCICTFHDYETHYYSPGSTEGRLSRQEIDAFMNEVRIIYSTTVYKLYGYIFCVVISYCFLDYTDLILDIDVRIIVSVWECFALYILIRFIRKPRERKRRLEALVNYYNPALSQFGLRWHFPSHGRWVELWKVFKCLGPS